MKILVITAEVAPFFSSGGLGDTIEHHARGLARLGHDVMVVAPLFPEARKRLHLLRPIARDIPFNIGGENRPYGVHVAAFEGSTARVLLVEAPAFFELEKNAYGSTRGPKGLGAWRFVFFGAVARHAAKVAEFTPDVMCAHDWPAALALAFARADQRYEEALADCALVFTAHAPEYIGEMNPSDYIASGALEGLMSDWYLLHEKKIALLKAGIVFADRLVVPQPIGERVAMAGGGYPLAHHWESRKEHMHPVSGASALARWDPGDPGLMPFPYGPDDLHGKSIARRRLFEDHRLAPTDGLVIAVPGDLTEKGGASTFLRALPALLADPDIRVVAVGRGDPDFEERLMQVAQRMPKRFAVILKKEKDALAATLAAADVALFAGPAGAQGRLPEIAQRLGTIPIVRAEGGRAPGVVVFGKDTEKTATAFGFDVTTTAAIKEAVRLAKRRKSRIDTWKALVARAMRSAEDDVSAKEYEDIYRLAKDDRKGKSRDADLLAHLFRPAGAPPLAPHRAIPAHYGRDHVRLMPRDPYHVFVYWESEGPVSRAAFAGFTPEELAAVRFEIVMTDVTGKNRWSIDAGGAAKNWFVRVEPYRRYEAAVLIHTPRRGPVLLGRSYAVDAPPAPPDGG